MGETIILNNKEYNFQQPQSTIQENSDLLASAPKVDLGCSAFFLPETRPRKDFIKSSPLISFVLQVDC